MSESLNLSKLASKANAVFNSVTANATSVTSLTVNGNISLSGGIYANGSLGTTGQVLTSNGSITFWQSAAAFDSGTSILFQQTTAPTGWTKSTSHDNKALRVVSGTASSGGSVAFTTAFASQAVSGTVGNTTLATTQIPAHNHTGTTDTQGNHSHTITFVGGTGGSSLQFVNEGTGGSLSTSTAGAHSHNLSINNTGGGQAHNHSFTGTAINLAVQYVDVIIATKD